MECPRGKWLQFLDVLGAVGVHGYCMGQRANRKMQGKISVGIKVLKQGMDVSLHGAWELQWMCLAGVVGVFEVVRRDSLRRWERIA